MDMEPGHPSILDKMPLRLCSRRATDAVVANFEASVGLSLGVRALPLGHGTRPRDDESVWLCC